MKCTGNNVLQDSEFDKLQERLTLEGKMIVGMKDPNRPRFTMNELRDVLKERNELKTKLLEVEEELSLYRPEYVFINIFFC